MNNYIMTVDPGVYNVGFCTWLEMEFFSDFVACPVKAYVHEFTGKLRDLTSWQTAMSVHIEEIEKAFSTLPFTECYVEKPKPFNSARGYATTASGHLQQLELFRGRLYQLCMEYDVLFHDVDVIAWKGQLPKRIVNDRIRKVLRRGTMVLSKNGSHDWDACGIGLFVQGYL